MPEFPFAGRQAADDLAQRSGSAQLTEQQSDELCPTGHPLGVLVGLVPLDCSAKIVRGKNLRI
jgi:hypothetical protein